MQLVERYLPGSEISVELVVDRGRRRSPPCSRNPAADRPVLRRNDYLTRLASPTT